MGRNSRKDTNTPNAKASAGGSGARKAGHKSPHDNSHVKPALAPLPFEEEADSVHVRLRRAYEGNRFALMLQLLTAKEEPADPDHPTMPTKPFDPSASYVEDIQCEEAKGGEGERYGVGFDTVAARGEEGWLARRDSVTTLAIERGCHIGTAKLIFKFCARKPLRCVNWPLARLAASCGDFPLLRFLLSPLENRAVGVGGRGYVTQKMPPQKQQQHKMMLFPTNPKTHRSFYPSHIDTVLDAAVEAVYSQGGGVAETFASGGGGRGRGNSYSHYNPSSSSSSSSDYLQDCSYEYDAITRAIFNQRKVAMVKYLLTLGAVPTPAHSGHLSTLAKALAAGTEHMLGMGYTLEDSRVDNDDDDGAHRHCPNEDDNAVANTAAAPLQPLPPKPKRDNSDVAIIRMLLQEGSADPSDDMFIAHTTPRYPARYRRILRAECRGLSVTVAGIARRMREGYYRKDPSLRMTEMGYRMYVKRNGEVQWYGNGIEKPFY